MFKPLRTALIALLILACPRANAQCCDHILVMDDSYGDDWNGATLTISVNGDEIGVFAAIGEGSTATFTVCNGDILELFYTSGTYENENSYSLFDEAGNIIYMDGPTPGTGSVFSGVVDCDAPAAPGSSPCAAIPIDPADCVIANNSFAPGTGFNPNCANFQGGDTWYTMPVPPSGTVVVSTFDTGGLNDTAIALWLGSNCFEPTLLACDDDGGSGYFSNVLLSDLPMGGTLYIQVYGYGGGTGAFELCVTVPDVITLESSELPIVLINTLGQTITQGPKIDCLMEMKYNGPGILTHVSDTGNVYDGNIGIEIRGATSSGFPQTPYGFETRTALGANLNVPLLDMPAENDWVLLSNYNDRSLIKNQLAFSLFEGMGQYAPRTHLCEVLLNDTYRGIYLFGEKIKRDDGRVDIATLSVDENTGDDLTGGYILEQNYWNANNSFESNYSPIDHPGFDVHFLYEYPAPDVITIEQRDYIAAFVDSLETALYSEGFDDPITGYRAYLDVPSFIAYFLVNELARNNDGFKKSVFFHKDKNSNGGKLKAGPVWDFDWAWKDLASCEIFSNTDGSGWAHRVNDCFTDNYSCGWYVRLLQDPAFANELRCTYEEYRTTVLATEHIFAYIDSVAERVENAQVRHFQRWPVLGVPGFSPEVNPVATTYAAELDSLKGWISRRSNWLDENIPGLCSTASIAERGSSNVLSVDPNPSNGLFHITGELCGPGPFRFIITDMAGRQVEQKILHAGMQGSDLEIAMPGSYFYAVRRGSELIQRGKLIVQ